MSSGPALTPLSATGVPKVAARRCWGFSESNAVVFAFIIKMQVLYVYPDCDAIPRKLTAASRIVAARRDEAHHTL
jgi:hypothetical protein